MSRYVLVHGAWEGSWSWEGIVPALKAKGHEVELVDLPGSIGNEKPISDVTFKSYVRAVKNAIKKSDKKTILVAHSLGGIAISQAAEEVPENIDKLVYVTAFFLKSGENALGAMKSETHLRTAVGTTALHFSDFLIFLE